MIIGFVLLVSSCGFDACDALLVSEDIYPTQAVCQQEARSLEHAAPGEHFICSEVYKL